MHNSPHSTPRKVGSFNTLAQSGTAFSKKPAIILPGKGTDLSKKEALKGRAKRKVITQAMSLSLIDAEAMKGANEMTKSYWNTYHCQEVLFTADGRMHGRYCKNRFCTLCCSIRKAKAINDYYPIIKTWSEPYFLTLTVLSLRAKDLHWYLRKILEAFSIIRNKYRKRNLRRKGIKLVGVKSLECNFNPEAKTYNPHLHIIVETRQMADILLEEWLSLWAKKKTKRRWVTRKAQSSRKVEDISHDLIEIIKYGSKIFTEPDVKNKMTDPGARKIYVAALDNIFKAMRGLRIFERFGFNLSRLTKSESENSRVVQDYDEWAFSPNQFDWLNTVNEHSLSEYKPSQGLLQILNNNIDVSDE